MNTVTTTVTLSGPPPTKRGRCLEHVLNCTQGSKRSGVNVLGEENGAAGVRGRGREGIDDGETKVEEKKPLLLE
eukprot:763110-Ditylum_brightwellii.AAC.1